MKAFSFLKKKRYIFVVIVAVFVGAYFAFFGKNEASKFDIFIAEKTDLIQEVSVTGSVEPADSVDLAFENGGSISQVYVKVGDEVKRGEALIRLVSAELFASLREAEAGVESAKAKHEQLIAALETEEAELSELKSGTRPEEIAVQEVKVENARVALTDTINNLTDKLKDSYTKSEDAVRNLADQLFDNPRSTNPQINITVEYQLETRLEFERLSLESTLTKWDQSINTLDNGSDLNRYTSEAKNNLEIIRTFLENLSLGVNALYPTTDLTQTTIDGYKTDVASARTNVNTAVNAVSVAEEKYKSAQSSLTLEENQLVLKRAGPTEEQIKAAEGQVKQASANLASQVAQIKLQNAKVANLEVQIGKTSLRAPFEGIITKVDFEVGEFTAAGTNVISIISKDRFQVETNVPEIDIAKISLDDKAVTTLDAYGDDVKFNLTVVSIDPAEVVIDGVPTYKVTLQFESPDERIRPGMTANIDIETARLQQVIAVPQRSVIRKDGKKIIRIEKGETYDEVEVRTGLRSSDGKIEVITGLSEGDRVITFINEN